MINPKNKIAIHKSCGGFSDRWIHYCEAKGIPYKVVDCYRNDILTQLSDCIGLLWQYYQGNFKDYLMAKPLMNALEHSGVNIFPDFRTAWHFDDKVGQKYLLEAIGAPVAPSWVFYSKHDAIEWTAKAEFPVVFKLRGGAGAQNVSLVQNRKRALKLIRKAFGDGIPIYNSYGNLMDRWRLYRLKKTNLRDVIEGVLRLAVSTSYARRRGKERGYIYFQKFIPNNDSDIRVVVIRNRAFAIKRMTRKSDFRASGSGDILYDNNLINEDTVKLAFNLASRMESKCTAFDFVYQNESPVVLEISYGFSPQGYDLCPGYWDMEMQWHAGSFDPYGWIVDDLIKDAI